MIEFEWVGTQRHVMRALTYTRALHGGRGTREDLYAEIIEPMRASELLALKRIEERGLWEARPKWWIERSEIDLLLATLLSNVHSDRIQIAEALASGVKPAKVAALYTGDSRQVAEGIRARLLTMTHGQRQHLHAVVTPLGRSQGGTLHLALEAERCMLDEPAGELEARLSKVVGETLAGTQSRQITYLPKLLSYLLSWAEVSRARPEHLQLAHVWLAKQLLQVPPFTSR